MDVDSDAEVDTEVDTLLLNEMDFSSSTVDTDCEREMLFD